MFNVKSRQRMVNSISILDLSQFACNYVVILIQSIIFAIMKRIFLLMDATTIAKLLMSLYVM